MNEPAWVFEAEPHVCARCGSERWHANKFWANWQRCWFDGDEEGGVDKWCHDCDGETSIMPKDEWEGE